MKRGTRMDLAMLEEASEPLPFSPQGAKDILDSDARQRAEIRELREKSKRFDAITKQHDCDHSRRTCEDVGCIGNLLDLEKPLKEKL